MIPLFLIAGTSESLAREKSLRIELQNDLFFRSDNQFTNGLSAVLSSPPEASLELTGGTPAFGKSLFGWMLPDDGNLTWRESWTIGQNLQTPDNISTERLILDDVPYIGMLGWGNSFYGFNDSEFWGVQWLFGWVGEPALGEEGQSTIHNLLGSENPDGWDNQLDFEPLLNVYFSRKHKLVRKSWFDVAVTGDLAAGNFFTYVQPGLEFRLGNLPEGFTFLPGPVGRNLDYDAVLNPSPQHRFYASATLRFTHFLWALPREGNLLVDNTWTDDNVIDIERNVGQAVFGLHWEGRDWGAHLSFWVSTDTIADVNGQTDRDNSFGALMLERRF
ncbi:lipid A-modifier LpxR family protein [Marinobacter sp.]|uniref:lipid A-modifier LpxR family protein n=1 Tax=Marinobacter sp. TaxID=50741 RepID=UPI00384E31D8